MHTCIVKHVYNDHLSLRKVFEVSNLPSFLIVLGVNFNNILHAACTYESFALSFFVLTFKVFKNFGCKNTGANALIKCW
jgi:hypothetical protein